MKKLILGLAVLLLSTGCSGDSTGVQASVAGVYTLRTVNGQALPVLLIQDASSQTYVDRGDISLNADGTFSIQHHIRTVSGSQTITSDNGDIGTYTSNGGAVVLRVDASTVFTASLAGSDLTISEAGVVFVYRK